MQPEHTCIFMVAFWAWGCASTDGQIQSQAGGSSGLGGGSAGEGGGAPIAGGGAASGAGGANHGGGATGGSGASAGSAGTSGGGAQRCESPKDRSGNWSQCSNLLLHRTTPGSCDSNLPRAQVLDSLEATDECRQDSDCTKHPHGFCEATFFPPFDYSNKCNYGCVSDSDCKADELCVCMAFTPFADGVPSADPASPTVFNALIGTCQASEDGCHSDADCNAGIWCTNFVAHCTGTGVRFACQTPNDECASHFDCPGSNAFCGYENGARVCQQATCEL